MSKARLLSLLVVGLAIIVRSSSAFAQTQLYLSVPGISAIGTFNGRTIAATLSVFGCVYQDLAPATLATDYALHGTSGNDTINVVSIATYWCNLVLQPINQNTHQWQTYGGAGDDVIYGGGVAVGATNPNWIYGEDGNDTLYLGPSGSRADGGAGNDKLYGTDDLGDILLGGDGNDSLCEHKTAVPLVQDGGNGTDTACSPNAQHGQFINIESISCTPCGSGY